MDAPKAMSVTGPVDASELGVVMMHEHILHGDDLFEQKPGEDGAALAERPVTIEILGTLWRWPLANRANVTFRPEDGIAEELALYREAGGGTVVDMTNVGMTPDPEGVAQVSRDSGVTIVMGCGWFVDGLLPDSFDPQDLDGLTAGLVRDLTVGIAGTHVRAGIIGEVGMSPDFTPREVASLRASGRASLATGAAISVHLSHSVSPGAENHQADEPGFEAMSILRAEGVDPDRIICGHLDEARNVDYAQRLIDLGCYVGYDTFGTEWYWDNWKTWEPHDSQRVADVAELCRRGLHDRIVLSQDVAMKRQLHRFGGLGFDHLLTNIVPMLQDAGVTEAQLQTMLVDNPRRLLTIEGLS